MVAERDVAATRSPIGTIIPSHSCLFENLTDISIYSDYMFFVL
jgi:hypothetical protein